MKNVYSKLKGYSITAIDHFLNPRNVGEIENATFVATARNPVCGDLMKLYVDAENGKIRDVKMKAFGCTALIACASMLTELMKSKTMEECSSITAERIISELGKLPDEKRSCAKTAEMAINMILENWRGKK